MLRLNLIICLVLALPAVPARAEEPIYHFAIAPAPVADVIKAFTAVTGAVVQLPAIDGVGQLPSPGVTGDFSSEQALDRLLAGTALAPRRNGRR